MKKVIKRENAVEVKIPRERISLQEVPEHEYGSYYGLSGVPISYQERRIWHLHEEIDRKIGYQNIPDELLMDQVLESHLER